MQNFLKNDSKKDFQANFETDLLQKSLKKELDSNFFETEDANLCKI